MSHDLARRVGPRLHADPRRVIGQLFVPGEESPHGRSRAAAVITRLLTLDDDQVAAQLEATLPQFAARHRDLNAMLLRHCAIASHGLPDAETLSIPRQLLIGACFTSEFAAEAAALFNPAMAEHPDQSGLLPGERRFVMTVRCLGEGHVSSIGFRTGVVGATGEVTVDPAGPLLTTGAHDPAAYGRRLFARMLADQGIDHESVALLTDGLPDPFSRDDLTESINEMDRHGRQRDHVRHATDAAHAIAESSYEVSFEAEVDQSSRLLWPTSPAERNGMEDARLVRFIDDDGTVRYYATYTAYDGDAIATHLLETADFNRFVATPVAGTAARNKGLALFPRRVGGRFLALSRSDRESLAIVGSDDLRMWDDPTPLYSAEHSWEAIQIGNGGSPIETSAGWLVLTHGVGPMRSYALGAILLDRDDPSRVIATLPQPLLTAAADERDGYVPNVVYTCGALLHDGVLTIPYGISDMAIGFAQLGVDELLGHLVSRRG